MVPSRSFSVFLLKPGQDASNSLKEDHGLDASCAATDLPAGAILFVLDARPQPPWWRKYFGIERDLFQVGKGALVFMPVADRIFALAFGHVRHRLDDASYEYDFGLRTTLNCIDPSKIKSADLASPVAGRRQRTQMPVGSDLTFFDFDQDSTILRDLTGAVRPECRTLIEASQMSGSSNLKIYTKVSANEIEGLCERLLDLYDSEDYKSTFPDIQSVTPVRDPIEINTLNSQVVDAIRARAGNIVLAVPDMVDHNADLYSSFSGAGTSLMYEDTAIIHYYEYLDQRSVAASSIDLSVLKRHNLELVDSEAQRKDRHSIYKSIIFDTSLDDGGTYHIFEGNWYRIDDSYIEKMRSYLDPFFQTLDLPAYEAHREDEYNISVVRDHDPESVCLDKTSISPRGYSQVEPCDLYRSRDGYGVLIHVKKSTDSQELSHLFNQGANSAALLLSEDAAADRLRTLVEGRAQPGAVHKLMLPLRDLNIKVVFAIITHKDPARRSDNLPLFSRISLMRALKEIKGRRVPACIGFIPDNAPRPASKKKPRKSIAGSDTV